MLKQGGSAKIAQSPRYRKNTRSHTPVIFLASSPRSPVTARNSPLPRKNSAFKQFKFPSKGHLPRGLKRHSVFPLQHSTDLTGPDRQIANLRSILSENKSSVKQYRAVLSNCRVLFSSLYSLFPSGGVTQNTAFLATSKEPSLCMQLSRLQARTCRVLCSLKARTGTA